MKIRVELRRIARTARSTLGVLDCVVGGALKTRCFAIEDEKRAVKVSRETRIPQGEYRLKLRRVGGFHSRYAARYPRWHRGMIQIADVPNFRFVLFHAGNTEKDTAGCILPNSRAALSPSGDFYGQASVAAYRAFYTPIAKILAAGGEASFRIVDDDSDEFFLIRPPA